MNVFKKTLLEFVIVVVVCALLVLVVNFFIQEDSQEYDADVEAYDEYLQVRIKDAYLDLEIAADNESRALGLMHREELEPDEGMIFIYEYEGERSFWMNNVLIPLDMIFLDADREIVGILEDVPICEEDPCPTYSIEEESQYVIEVNAGWVSENDISVGDRVDFIMQDLSDS